MLMEGKFPLTLSIGMNQFAPLDIPSTMDAFLQYWRPNAVMLMESELWPNLIMGAARNGVSYSFSLQLYIYSCLSPTDLMRVYCWQISTSK